jgi:hypothetical protein
MKLILSAQWSSLITGGVEDDLLGNKLLAGKLTVGR